MPWKQASHYTHRLVATINTVVDTHTGNMSGIVSGTFSSQEKKKKNIMEQNASHVNATIFGLKPVLTTKVITTDTVRLKLGPDTVLHTSIIILTSDF